MKMSRRAQRMERHHRKHKFAVSLNLVSLMDIFTILVFFLLVNSAEVEILPSSHSVSLPQSVSKLKPHKTITIIVAPGDISVQGRRIVTMEQVQQSDDENIPALQRYLEKSIREKAMQGQDAGNSDSRPEVTIMADKTIPYRILKKVLLSCSESRFGKVSFAVIQELADTPS